MTPSTPWPQRLAPLVYLSNNWISRIGVVLTTTGGLSWLFLLPFFLGEHADHPYLGVLFFLIIPGVFFAGLALIPIGIAFARRRGKTWEAAGLPALSWTSPYLRTMVLFIAGATLANLVIGASFVYRSVEHMDSPQFCGATCHPTLKAEFEAYQHSPHSKVPCVKCHIGPGASFFVKSKASGALEAINFMTNNYPRPLPTPIVNLRPARDTCESCHWPDKYGGDRLKVIRHYSDEGKASQTVLMLHIGGGNFGFKGIHGAHVGRGIRIRYAADPKRENIPWVEYSLGNEKRVFQTADFKDDKLASLEMREMDCMDCHNRPSHTFEKPERAIDNALAAGEIPLQLPLIRKRVFDVVTKSYATSADAEREIPAAIAAAYPNEDKQVLARAQQAAAALWRRNVNPEMKLTWGYYPNHLGHTDWPGCFRCHDGSHSTKDNSRTVSNDCTTCHEMLAMEEEKPEILTKLGVAK